MQKVNSWRPLGPDLQNILRFIINKHIERSTYDSDLKRAKISLKLIYEHYLRRSYNFASESYLRKNLSSS